MILFIQLDPPILWGSEQPEKFLEHMLILGLYKEMTAQGYCKVIYLVKLGYVNNHKSFAHNWALLRKKLAKWGRSLCTLGTSVQWTEAAANVSQPKRLTEINLWMDLSDFPKQKFKGCFKKEMDWRT